MKRPLAGVKLRARVTADLVAHNFPALPIDESTVSTRDGDVVRCRALFATIVEYARRGERCPTAEQFDYLLGIAVSPPLISAMADAGLLRVEVAAKNWRTLYICAGPDRGLHTMPPKGSNRPYLVKGPGRPTAA